MRLTDLDATFVGELSKDGKSYREVDSIVYAQGIMLQCPVCAVGKPIEEKDGKRFVVGVHSILCWFKNSGVPDEQAPKPGRWIPAGTGLHDLTFVGPGAASVQITGGCNAHFFVKNGEAL